MCEAEAFYGEVQAVTPWEAALRFAEEHQDKPEPGWKFTVYAHSTGVTSEFVVDDSGNIVPVE